ncbi:MAG: UbiA family prenyltransferase [Gemmatimonadota bacterium]|nr:UbiA family prenyltransferase [Gemmatimonadota bacterium]
MTEATGNADSGGRGERGPAERGPGERGPGRWWVYQRERFPLARHGPLILAFSFSAVSFSWMLRSPSGWPSPVSAVVAFASCLIFFLQLRIADEFKDDEEDARYRPYRPVPRGLVTLRELGGVFVLVGALQLALALWLDARLLVLLLVTWTYLTLMSKEFFVGDWLRGKHLTYMVTHMAIMPLIDLYATSTDWLVFQGHPPSGLFWFLLASLFNGMVIEIGRKIRSPHDEEEGVANYSVVWGRPRAVGTWWLVMGLTFGCAFLAARRIGFVVPLGIALGATLVAAVLIGALFLRRQTPGAGAWIENWSGIWTLVLYLSLGPAPLLWRELG